MTETRYEGAHIGAPGGDEDHDPDAERIVTEIETTRSDMGATIDEIGHRLQPQTIASEAADKLKEATIGKMERAVNDAGYTAQQTSTTFVETVKQNPVPAALAGIGIGWLVMRMRDQRSTSGYGNGSRSYDSRYGYGTAGYGSSGYGSAGYANGGRGNGGSSVSGQDPMERVRSVADDATGRVQEVGSNVQQSVQEAQWQAQHVARDAQRQFDRTLNDNPLAIGVLALGVGAAVGMALPSTRREQELMGEQRDRLVEKASVVASQALDQVETRAEEMGQEIKSQTEESQGGDFQNGQGQSGDDSSQQWQSGS